MPIILASYITMQFSHMFVFAARVWGLTTFRVNVAQYKNPAGVYNSYTVTSSSNGLKAYCSSYSGVGFPSANIMVIINNDPAVTATFQGGQTGSYTRLNGI
jgi:hypothetical protein